MQLLKKNKVPGRERDSRYIAKRKKSKFKRRSGMIFLKLPKKYVWMMMMYLHIHEEETGEICTLGQWLSLENEVWGDLL